MINLKTIEGAEAFDLIMKNLFIDNGRENVIKIINNDSRKLSYYAFWVLDRRGFTQEEIPKLEVFYQNSQSFAIV